jgi:glycerol-3-phosphate dehydrogenase
LLYRKGKENMYDVIIIGAGVTGSAVARELSRKKRKVAVLERCSDICEGTSKANSGIVHAGFDAKPGSLKARLNVEGSRRMEALSKELDFSYRRNGSIVLCFDEKDRGKLEDLLEKARANGVEGCRIISGDEVRQMEPQISEEVVAAFYAPTGGIVCPFGLTIALAENACTNGVEFYLNQEVVSIEKKEGGYLVCTGDSRYETRTVVNAAGVYADVMHNMVSADKMEIIQRKGEYCLMDKKVGNFVSHTIFQMPTKYGKGVLVTPTVHGNLMAGPTAVDIPDKEGVNTTADQLADLLARAKQSTPELPARQVITSFAGLRAHLETDDFVIEEVKDAPGFIDVAGIESPGISSAPAIGSYVAQMIDRIIPAEDNPDFEPKRKGIVCMQEASMEEKQALIAENPAYANVICRCEMVTEGEILDAIHRPLGATTQDGIKRRTRAGMGRCQSGFCAPKTVEILARELGKDMAEITKNGGKSTFLTGYNKEDV